jgi:hypothetical protein
LAYCEVRSWARQAGEPGISEYSTQIFTRDPFVSKDAFLAKVDQLITALELLKANDPAGAANHSFPSSEREPQSKVTMAH